MPKIYNVTVRTWSTADVWAALKKAGYSMRVRRGNFLIDVRPDMTVVRTTTPIREVFRPYFDPHGVVIDVRAGARVEPRASFLEYNLIPGECDASRLRIGCSKFERRSVENAIAVSDRMVRRSRGARRAVTVTVHGWNDRNRTLKVYADGAIGYPDGSRMAREYVLLFKRAVAAIK